MSVASEYDSEAVAAHNNAIALPIAFWRLVTWRSTNLYLSMNMSWRRRQEYQAVAFEQAIIKHMEATSDGAQAARLRPDKKHGHRPNVPIVVGTFEQQPCFQRDYSRHTWQCSLRLI